MKAFTRAKIRLSVYQCRMPKKTLIEIKVGKGKKKKKSLPMPPNSTELKNRGRNIIFKRPELYQCEGFM